MPTRSARARGVPLRAPRPARAAPRKPLLRDQRRRVVGRQPDAARRARHRVQPLRPHVLRPEPERDGLVDRRLPQRVPGSNRAAGQPSTRPRTGGSSAPATTPASEPARCGSPAGATTSARCRPAGARTRSGSGPTSRSSSPATRTSSTGRRRTWWRSPTTALASTAAAPSTATASTASTAARDPVPRPTRDRHAAGQGASADPQGRTARSAACDAPASVLGGLGASWRRTRAQACGVRAATGSSWSQWSAAGLTRAGRRSRPRDRARRRRWRAREASRRVGPSRAGSRSAARGRSSSPSGRPSCGPARSPR